MPIVPRLPVDFLRDFAEVQFPVEAFHQDFDEVARFLSRDWMNTENREFRRHVFVLSGRRTTPKCHFAAVKVMALYTPSSNSSIVAMNRGENSRRSHPVFVHQSRLEHLLRPCHYVDDGHYQREIERLFQPAWHLAGSRGELARPGDFLTLELFDRPVLVRNIDGEIHAFLNVCAHRHCLLTHETRGHDPRFRCQYHGWEYTKEGRTARIPDASCFRPFDRDNAQLRKFRVGTAGDLVFVALSDEAPSLAEYLGAHQAICEQAFAPPYRRAWEWRHDLQCNWKVPVENTLETYHIPCLHSKTFQDRPSEENTEHQLQAGSTTLCTPEPPSWARTFQNFMVRRLGLTPGNLYIHHHVHPNLVLIRMDVMRLVQAYFPTSPTSCRLHFILYTLRGRRRGPLRFLLGQFLKRLAIWVTRSVIGEDLVIFPDQQRGLKSSPHPGALGTLEERVYAFQKWVMDNCDRSALNSAGPPG